MTKIIMKSLLAALLLLPMMANAGTVQGKLNGLSCAVANVFCPIDKLDPYVALEKDFVVQQADGSFYLLPNVDRAVKARLVLDDVTVTGDVNEKYKTVNAESIAVNGKVVWSREMEEDLQKQLFKGSQ